MKQNVLTLFTGAAASGTADALVPGAPVAATPGGATATHVSPARPRERRKKEAVSAGGDEHETVNVPAGHFNILDAKDCACGWGTKFRRTADAKKRQRHWRCSLGCGATPSAHCVCALQTVPAGARVPIMCTTGTCFAKHVQDCMGAAPPPPVFACSDSDTESVAL